MGAPLRFVTPTDYTGSQSQISLSSLVTVQQWPSPHLTTVLSEEQSPVAAQTGLGCEALNAKTKNRLAKMPTMYRLTVFLIAFFSLESSVSRWVPTRSPLWGPDTDSIMQCQSLFRKQNVGGSRHRGAVPPQAAVRAVREDPAHYA